LHRIHKAPGGPIRADFEMRDGTYQEVCLSGDWFCYLQVAIPILEENIRGVSPEELPSVLKAFYAEHGIETPGIRVEDWLDVLKV
jgi:hypothetical protein